MRRSIRQAAILTLVGIALLETLASCSPSDNRSSDKIIYVVSGSNNAEWYPHTAVHIVDMETETVLRSVKLPKSWVRGPGVDPSGRLWIGLSGTWDKTSNDLWIVDRQGRVVKKLKVGEAPETGIAFGNGCAYACCRKNGFSGEVWVIDLTTLAVKNMIVLPAEPYAFTMLESAAADEEHLVVASAHSMPPEALGEVGLRDLAYSEVFIVDTRTNTVERRVDLGRGTAVWDIVSSGNGLFYLINNSAFQSRLAYPDSPDNPGDILVLDQKTGAIVKQYDIGGFPMRGVLQGSSLTLYCRIWSSKYVDERRAVAWLDLDTGQYRRVDLPARFRAEDILAVDGSVYLVGWLIGSDRQDGIYRLEGDKPVLICPVEDASEAVVAGAPSQGAARGSP